MDVSSHLRDVRISPQKVRLVADQVRGMPIAKAIDLLKYMPKKAAGLVLKCLNAAIANAENNLSADIDLLRVSTIYVDQGAVLKRIQPRAKGRANRILKRSSHITVTVSD